jgi:alpha-galactosidase
MIHIRTFDLVSILFLCLFCFEINAQEVIVQLDNPKGWLIETDNSVYQLFITNDNKLRQVYYGHKKDKRFVHDNPSWTNSIDEVPARGGNAQKTPAVEVIFEDGNRDIDLIYESGEIIMDEGLPVLKIIQKDSYYPLKIISYFKVYKEFDIIEKWISVENMDKSDKILIENLLSGGIVLPDDNYYLTYLSGSQMNEFQIQQTPLTPGLKTIESRAFKTNQNAPWFMIETENTKKDDGSVWFGSIHYSGNWALLFDKAFNNVLQVIGGINFWDTNWTLRPGETFTTPKMTFGYSNKGTDLASINLSNYIRKHILPVNFRNELRPVLYNSWEATYYNVNEQQQKKLANYAKEIGIELFVVDDGWFKDRTDGKSSSGLGNFDVDKEKFPNGLKPLIDHVHNLGMQFGLWVEPENINPNSDVYRTHPDWIFQFPNRNTSEKRKTLNLANEGAYNYLLNSLIKLLEENEIDFIKWDQNNYLLDPGWKNAPDHLDREARIRHIQNVYKLVTELRKKFPKVIFETCASGGGRVDLGMLSLMDQAWTSDNTDPLDRLFVQHGFLKMLPPNVMGAWVTSMTRHQEVPLEYRFDVSMGGVLGVGANISNWTVSNKEVAIKKIKLYKTIRPIIQFGNYYSIISPFEKNRTASQYVSQDRNCSVVFCFNMAHYLSGSQYRDRGNSNLKLKGLLSDYLYIVKDSSNDKEMGTYSGDYLMNIGLRWPVENKALKSKILLIDRLEKTK